MAGLGTEVGDAYIEVHASTGPFRRELRREAKLISEDFGKRFNAGLLGVFKGSRNDFLNIIGSIGGGLERLTASGFNFFIRDFGRGVASLGSELKELGGPLAKLGGFFDSLGNKIQNFGSGGLDGLIVKLALFAVTIQVSIGLVGVFSAGLSLLTGAATALAVTLGGALLGGLILLGPLLAGLVVGAATLALAFSDLSDEQKAAFGPLKTLFDETRSAVSDALFRDMGSQIESVTSALTPFKDILVSVADATREWFTRTLEAFEANTDLQNSLSKLGEALPGLFTSLLTLIGNIGSSLTGLFAAASPAAQTFLDKINGVVAQFSAWVNSAEGQETINEFLNTALDIMTQLWDIAKELGTTLGIFFEEGNEAGGQFLEKIRSILEDFNTWLTDEGGREQLTTWFNDSVTAIKEIGAVLGRAIELFDELDNPNTRLAFVLILTAFEKMIGLIRDVQHWVNTLTGAVQSGGVTIQARLQHINAVIESVKGAFRTLADGARDAVGSIGAFFASLPGRIQAFFGDVGNLLYSAGSSIVNGLRNGIAAAAQGVLNYISSLAGRISSAFKSALGIRSPSRLFAEYGMNIAQGLAQGINASTGLVDSAMGNLIDSSTLSNLNTPVSDLATQGSATSSAAPSAGTVIENGAITVVSPYADPMLVAVEVMDALAVRGK